MFNFWLPFHPPSQFRDDNKKLHPCLVDFQSLPEPERNYNLQMSGETLKYVCAVGFWDSAQVSHSCRRRFSIVVDTVVDPPIYALQDSPGAWVPCWYGWWESRRESEEDQVAKDVCEEYRLYLPNCFITSLCLTWRCVSFRYVMSNGYKPAPLDLSHVRLTPNQNQLVEKLAENGHNVWARDRVRQGWTYSIVQVTVCSRLFTLLFVCFLC